MSPIWITGTQGLIGSHLVRLAPTAPVRALTRADLDLLDFAAVDRAFQQDRPRLVIHCAAISVVAEAHKNPELARRVNLDVTRHLAGLAAAIPFVFFSTDLVFDGRLGNYQETDAPNPLNVYGETKLAAEAAVRVNPRHLIVRTSINAGPSPNGRRAFDEQLRQSLASAGSAMTLFNDEFRCPIAAAETARAVWELVAKQATGIVHVAGSEKLSRQEIGELLLPRWSELHGRVAIKSGSAKDFPGPPRALDTSLKVAKAEHLLGRPLPRFSEWLKRS
ncbi:MAG TPA: SDR family oxidoreductase [Verrucomicrobiae bacterium]